ncbi:Vascular endothelial growth factor receptor kdr-like [Orchesella cincta]|uniref:Vascular endothelial growth factor receptor kdr-like n=1 Tax=Orchesella cincta TaxID=48709 RepID=A0A1D2MQ26_ORCCI|nr:Vascular endothelial growth factor receptor kdr-like [Orchesella cincta]
MRAYMAHDLKLIIILVLVLDSVKLSVSQEAPKVSISFPDVADQDFNNETTAIMTNSNPIFKLHCQASYPVEWIIQYTDEDDGTSEKTKIAENRRIVGDFRNPQTYIYNTTLRMEYNGKLLVFVDFTCKATQSNSESLQTHVYMRDENKKSILILEITNKRRGNANPTPVNKDNCSRAVAAFALPKTDLIPCWRCETPTGKELELDYVSCRSATQCNSMHSQQNKGTKCLKRAQEKPPQCKIFSTVDYNPKAVVCKNFGPALAQFFFFGVFRGDIDDETAPPPPIYFDWTEVDPSEMIHIHPINEEVFVGEEIIVTCEYSKYYFALGSWFGVTNENGTKYYQGEDIKPCDTDVECFEATAQHRPSDSTNVWRGTYTANLPLKFEGIGQHKVICNGPIWNTTEWINASISFPVKKGENPEIISVIPDSKEAFIVGQTKRKLVCRFNGKPVPKVEWTGPNETHYYIHNGGDYSEITFSEIGFQTSGSNEGGISTFGIIAIVVSGLLIVGVALLVITRMRNIIQEQREALRILTEAEIQEFVEGNPDIVARAKNDYFNNNTAIDALPYDMKYEIPPDKLSIDYSCILGSGEYGLVLGGKVMTENVKGYVSISNPPDPEELTMNQEAETNNEELTVAVKMCKKDVDVTNFKALLAEIKVMAYLGNHKNLVSLIGAWELLIIVEFCKNGSLESYLRNNKQSFLNKVKYGYYTDGNDNANEGIVYANVGHGHEETCVFSSIELFKWTYEIAEAIEYMSTKKVIHGDLAVRNVLLTEDLVAKVSDFGLSRQLVETSSYMKKTQCALPWRHLAIESLKNLEFSVKSDMWAFGVTLWELYTLGDVPYPGLNYTQEFMTGLENGTVRLYKPSYATNDIYEFMLLCWSGIPEDRPSSSEIKIICDKLLRKARL